MGLATYILEKFSTWTNRDFRELEDGGLTRWEVFLGCVLPSSPQKDCNSGVQPSSCRKYSLDDLLTNVMIYWTSGCIVPSMRFYKENLGKGLDQPHTRCVTVRKRWLHSQCRSF